MRAGSMGLNPEPNLIMHEVEFFLCVVHCCTSAVKGEMVRSIAELPWRRRVPSLLNKDHPIPILSVGDFHEASTIQYLFVWGWLNQGRSFE
ncbi:hypothetical protein F2Q69_00053363 [Brassica cretica]|uniref:Uncharacterized protein n=1 Tax=Brassica cretica TaxID=69181 RepID=A0A8S9MQK3_BRACR|nr:hypothetical protein F2Q69_00053363 [Brassica cretica]